MLFLCYSDERENSTEIVYYSSGDCVLYTDA